MFSVDTSQKLSIRVLQCDSADRDAWNAAIQKLRIYDAFYSWEYLQMSSKFFKNSPILLTYGDREEIGIYPVILRSVNALPFWGQNRPSFFDVITPEYGGPAISSAGLANPRFVQQFRDAASEELRARNVVCEFARFNPFIEGAAEIRSVHGAGRGREIVYMDLTQSEEDLRKGLSKSNRYSINRAIREGISIRFSRATADIRTFSHLYNEAMERNDAREEYRHPEDFFHLLFESLGDGALLGIAERAGVAIAGAVLLAHGRVMHYYLAGSITEYLRLCPNNLLLYEIALYGRAHGYHFFNIGGWHHGPTDSLFHFKSSFSPLRAEFSTARIVHDPVAFDQLNRERDNLDAKETHQSVQDTDYFPPYRR